MSHTLALVERIESLRYEDLPEEARSALRTLLLDHLGVGARGGLTDSAAAVRDFLGRLGGPASARLPLLGTGEDAPAIQAALANAVAAHSIEYDDVHNGASSHPGVVVLPTALAAAVLFGGDERAFLLAVTRGYEVMCRVGRAVNAPAHYARHFHPTATTGVLGAAVTAASLLGLDREATVSALGIAATMASGSMEFLTDGAWTKRLHPGLAARNGIQAALLARAGFRGPRDGIGGPRGFLAGYSGDPRPERLLEAWGERPLEVCNTSIKAHTCCRYKQGPIDALLEIRREHGVRPRDVERITLGLMSPALDIVWEPVDDKRRPRSVVDAQFSMPFGAAVAIAEGKAGLEQYDPSRLGSSELRELMDRVECTADPELDRAYPERWGAWARVRTRDGRELEARVADPKGDPPNPLSEDERSAKFDDLTAPVYSRDRQHAVRAAVRRISEPGALKELLDLLPADRSG